VSLYRVSAHSEDGIATSTVGCYGGEVFQQ